MAMDGWCRRPAHPKTALHYWLHYAEGSIQPMLLMKLIFDRIEKAPMPFLRPPDRQGDF